MRMEKFQFNQTKVAMVFAMLSLGLSANADVKVNEVMPCNVSTYMENYNYPGWVEVYNNATSSVNLKGYKFVHYKSQDDGTYKYDWTWKVTEDKSISGEAYKLFFFDGSDMDSRRDIKLDSDGGILVIRDASGAQVDSFVYKATQTYVSYGIGLEGRGYMEPTPKAKNGVAYASLSTGRCAQPKFSGDIVPGVIRHGGNVYLSTQTEGATIYYTTDGSEPTKDKKLYQGSISVEGNKVIRARAYKDGMISSSILTGSFIFVDSKHEAVGGFTLPIVSIVTDQKNFYDDQIGICVVGTNGKEPETDCLRDFGRANYLQDWTRPVNFEYIVNDQQVLSHEAEVAVMGGCSRGDNNRIKSLKIKAGNRMGSGNSKLKYDFFEDKVGNKYKSLQLRNGGNAYEAQYVRCRDGFMQSIAKPMQIDYQAYQPVAYYINGEYKGLMGLRERTNKAYVESNYGLDSKDIDVLEITTKDGVVCTCGDKNAYDKMVSFLESSDKKSDDFYSKASMMIDMDEYLDYEIFEQFIVNTDWPGNNTKMWREHENGRFRWVLFDTDFGFGLYGGSSPNYCTSSLNMIKWCMGEEKTNWANEKSYEVTIFKNLMKNPTFKERFLNRFIVHLGTTFQYDRVSAVWDSISSLVDNEYKAAFNTDLSSNGMMTFAKERPDIVYNHLREFYGLDTTISLKVSSSHANAHIMMNGEMLPASSFSGKYFANKELKLEAIAPAGYDFAGWQLNGAVSSVSNNMTWKYFTSQDGPSSDWKKVDFDDSSWKSGHGKMGYAKSSEASFYDTFIESGEEGNHYAAVFFRSTIDVEDCSALKDVNVDIMYDDAFVFYVNGVEIERANISGDPVSPTKYCGQYANNETKSFLIPASAWKQGKNVIAVEVHQHEAQSSDLTFVCDMSSLTGSNQVIDYVSTNPVYTLTADKATKVKAIFVQKTECIQPELVINEICSSNKANGGTSDEYGNYPDWFEVYNMGSDTINLAGMYLTDKMSNSTKYMIPYGYEETKLAPKSRLVFWADGKPFRGPLHVGFKLQNTSSAMLGINMVCENNVENVNSAEYIPMPANRSMGLTSDGGSEWTMFGDCENGVVYSPTPGGKNSSVYEPSTDCTTTDEEDIYYDEDDNMVEVYPNPVQDIVNIVVKDAQSMDVNVFDNMGRLVMMVEKLDASSSVDMTSLTTGIYHLEILTDGITYSRTIIKE